jgi:DNA-binding response OmpR family regulator
MSKKILIVEDEEVLKEGYQQVLSKKYTVKCAMRSEEVMNITASFKPDLILLDNGLPGGQDGIDLIPDIKKILPKTKIIIFSNHTAKELKIKTKNTNQANALDMADYCCLKFDVGFNNLVEKVKTWLQ